MATSAFKSTTKRTPIGSSTAPADDSASSNRTPSHRRSRSLSCFSRPLSEPPTDEFDGNPAPTPRGRFVNTVRGSGFPEISLDDLAIELFDSGGDRGRSAASKSSETNSASASQRRGRSVSRHGSRVGGGGDARGSACNNSGGGRVVSESKGNSRPRRSVSVARYQTSDSESDLDHTQNRSTSKSKGFGSGNSQTPLSRKSTESNYREGLRRSLSQKDLKVHDGYSSQSSVITDDEGRDAYTHKNGVEKTIRTVYAEKKAEHPTGNDMKSGFYEAMRKELRHAVEEIKTELELGKGKTKSTVSATGDRLRSNSSDVLQAVSSIKKNYSAKLEQSEKRKQDLLAEIVLEEQHSRELSKIVKELLPEPKNIAGVDKPLRTRRRSNDKGRMSKRLNEEAERYIEDFISNVEDTDISSLDGERSDTSSSIGGIAKSEIFQGPAVSTPLPVEMEVALPWLQWETSNDATPIGCKNKTEPLVTPKTNSWDIVRGLTGAQDRNQSASSRGSWSPGMMDALSMNIMDDAGSKLKECDSYRCQSYMGGSKDSQRFDMDKYLKLKDNEDFLFETLRQRQRISSGGLLLCNRMFM